MSWFQQAKSYWQNELANMAGIQQGNITPTQLPEFKGMKSMWNANMDNVLQNAIRQLSQSGVQGGKANQLLNSLQQGDQSGLLQLIQNIYSQVNQRGGLAADRAIDWNKFMKDYNLRAYALRKQNKSSNFGNWANIIRAAMGIAAAPFTGGTSLAAALPAIGSMAGGNSGGITGTGGLADWYTKTYGGLGG